MPQTLVTGAVGPVPIYKNIPAPTCSTEAGRGAESVARSVLTLVGVTSHNTAQCALSGCHCFVIVLFVGYPVYRW